MEMSSMAAARHLFAGNKQRLSFEGCAQYINKELHNVSETVSVTIFRYSSWY
jgi:hypothetical protein